MHFPQEIEYINVETESFPVIETNDILALIPHIDRDWAIDVLNLMDQFRSQHDDSDDIMESFLNERQIDENQLSSIEQIRTAELIVLAKAGLIMFS